MGMIVIAAIACIAVIVGFGIAVKYAIRIAWAILTTTCKKVKTVATGTGEMLAKTVRGERV